MKKKISKEQIIITALDLMRNKNDLRGLNLREIARNLGCAHTNIYNYFSSYNALLWKTHAALQEMFMKTLLEKLSSAHTAEQELICFFNTFVDFYLNNKGWFRLLWHEYIGGNRPKRDIIVTEESSEALNRHIAEIYKKLYNEYPAKERAKRVLHNIHCYMVGEISNYILGRGLIENETELKAYIVEEATQMFWLYFGKE